MSSSYTVEAVLKATGASQFQQAFANAEESVSKFKKAGKGMADVGKKLTKGLTVPIAGAGVASLKMASDFESGMSEVAALSGATGSDLEMLEAKAREMGAKTKYSATEASEGLQYMALAGWDAEQMAAGLEPSLLLAGAAGMELGNATDIVTDTMSMFQMEASEATKMTDMLAYAQANSNTDVNMLGEALVNVGANANAMGYDLADTSAILGIFADQGLKGGRAGTALSAIFRDMKKNAKDGAIAIGDTSVAIQDSEGNYRDMVDIIADIEQATDGMSDAQRDAALSTTFGDQAISGMNMALAAGSKEIAEFEDGIRSSDGAAKDMYDTMQDNLKGSFEELKSAISEAAISIGNVLIPVVSDLVGWINDWVDRFNALDESTQENIVKIGLMVAALGPLLMVGSKLLTGIGLLLPVLAALNAPIVAIVAAIGAVTVALVELYNENEEFRTAVVAIWESIKESAGVIWGSVKNIITTTVEVISKVVTAVFGGIKDFIDTNQDGILLIIETVWGLISSFIENTLGVIEGVINTVMGIITGDWERAWEGIRTIVESVWNHMENLVDIAINVIKTTIDAVLRIIQNIFDDVWGAIQNIVETVWESMKNTISNVADTIKNLISNKWDTIKSQSTTAWNNIKDSIVNVVISMKDSILEWVETLKRNMKSTLDSFSLRESGQKILNSLWDGLKRIWGDTKRWFGGLGQTMIDALSSVSLWDAGTSIISSLWDGMKSAWSSTAEWVGGLGGKIKNLKGPLSYDKVMLVDEGNAIMGGLNRGLGAGFKDVERNVGSMGQRIQDSLTVDPVMSINGQIARSNGQIHSAVSHEIGNSRQANSSNGDIIQNITVISPDPTSPSENARKMKQASRELARGW